LNLVVHPKLAAQVLEEDFPVAELGDSTMKLFATFAGLLIAASAALSTPAAVAMPASASASLQKAAAPPIETVQHRRSHTTRGHVVTPANPGADPYSSYGAYSYAPGHGVDDWSHWSPTHHPGWPCVRGPADETSAYPSWAVGPGCR
jgi:hypothetical protein